MYLLIQSFTLKCLIVHMFVGEEKVSNSSGGMVKFH